LQPHSLLTCVGAVLTLPCLASGEDTLLRATSTEAISDVVPCVSNGAVFQSIIYKTHLFKWRQPCLNHSVFSHQQKIMSYSHATNMLLQPKRKFP